MSKQHMDPSKKCLAGLGIMALLSAAFIAVSAPLYNSMVPQPKMPLSDGTYTSQEADFDEKGYRSVVTLTVNNGRITGCTWDCLNKDGVGKRQLSMEGQYVMTENGPTWKEQADALASYVLRHQTAEGLANEEGYAQDAVSSVSINVFSFVNGISDCLDQAASQTEA